MRGDHCREHAARLLPIEKVKAFAVLMDWDGAEVLHACGARLEVHDHGSCCASCNHHVIPHTRCILR